MTKTEAAAALRPWIVELVGRIERNGTRPGLLKALAAAVKSEADNLLEWNPDAGEWSWKFISGLVHAGHYDAIRRHYS